ncbi:hypothetical protein POJ06DRAFT_102179 [Lipomyces tetrasporus]|uniref:Fe2OG dioxygenase domain-containing protein n=1 Tax=Lipomyces tetrasporus TaxID=54092 RepID=A0AAD7VTN6_9ASCO|nr:uncharacterized protein POJ06DRAFT_102179 [Lipomyces tetrasporus]KAJ8100345.1 hypothetical protein POJ06DRAFT_102179 [Lipomyces tetrasporus]
MMSPIPSSPPSLQSSKTPASHNAFRPLYKFYRHLSYEKFDELCYEPGSNLETRTLLDPMFPEHFQELHPGDVSIATYPFTVDVLESFSKFIDASPSQISVGNVSQCAATIQEITLKSMPGLRIYPGILTPDVQRQLIVNVIEEYLPPETHLTNLHPSYALPQPFQLFGLPPDTTIAPSEKPTAAATSTTIGNLQDNKLRWVTLGGQYNWTTKKYPTFEPHTREFPDFPASLTTLLKGASPIFKDKINPEASIINFYSDGDILSPHQDIAELSNADLVSVSLGCEAVFFCGLAKDKAPLQVRVRSGDIIVMGGQSRFAWHGVGRIWDKTTPDYLSEFDYPGNFDQEMIAHNVASGRKCYGQWILSKRINLNVRQMLDS